MYMYNNDYSIIICVVVFTLIRNGKSNQNCFCGIRSVPVASLLSNFFIMAPKMKYVMMAGGSLILIKKNSYMILIVTYNTMSTIPIIPGAGFEPETCFPT